MELRDDPGPDVLLDFAGGVDDQWAGWRKDHVEKSLTNS